ncbi:R-spondin-1-like [Homarus americanus]|uniref:R-spondin-1-like n=1 Tax=Homarus americanus TaxID=6706 RepID=UPI001C495E9A|nr:R-spondin-1-like [Homarus americanus]
MEVGCPYGCAQCTPINGCLACKPPFFLILQREGARQTASCTRSCPAGFYKLKRNKKRGFCAKCKLRGCSECSTRHYCSVCKVGLVRHAGRCRKRCPMTPC